MNDTRTTASNCLIVIFGASGDLTHRKLIPSLYDLYCQGLMPEQFAVLGISRSKYSDQDYRDELQDSIKQFAKQAYESQCWNEFAQRLYYHPADSTDSDAMPGIKQRMGELCQTHRTGDNVLFYLSVAPRLYDPIIENIGRHNMVTEGRAWCSLDRENRPWQRIIVEKPFGRDLDTGAHLNRVLGRVFEDHEIYRIDHYLGKETVQNLLVFRFANTIFEPIWNSSYIDNVQITAAEAVGLEGRGQYYDSPDGGAMRDMIQSHLLQMLALVAMEPPVTQEAQHVRGEVTKVLNAVRQVQPEDVPAVAVRGQYTAGQVDGKQVPGFLEEEGVEPSSRTETYAAMQLFIDTWRWSGVPFYVRSGKAMPRKNTEIVIEFKPTPQNLFSKRAVSTLPPNQIVINVQPNEGIRLRFEGKVPGIGMKIRSVVMDFDYIKQFDADPPEAYATLLLDAMRGDQTLFKQRDEIEQAWRIVQPVLDAWEAETDQPMPTYEAGSWGPPAADVLLARDGRAWRDA